MDIVVDGGELTLAAIKRLVVPEILCNVVMIDDDVASVMRRITLILSSCEILMVLLFCEHK